MDKEKEKAIYEKIRSQKGEEDSALYQYELISDLKNTPHAFVLACIMDLGIPAERAWQIPSKIKEGIGSFELKKLLEKKEKIRSLFTGPPPLHWFHAKMAKRFINGMERIDKVYQGRADRIWQGNKSSGDIVCSFLEFDGVGVKIATMAANILFRVFKIPMSDTRDIDISPDVHIKRVFKRTGLVRTENIIRIMIKARTLNPEYPGKIDPQVWYIGRLYCRPSNPKCGDCPLDKLCEKNGLPSSKPQGAPKA